MSSFFGSLFGGDQRHDIQNANKQANSALSSGYNTANGLYGQAASNFDPYKQTGQQANTFYANALGLNGNDARSQAEGTITSDPLWSGAFAQDSNNVLKAMNARGLNGSGAAAAAGQRSLYQNYGNALDRYANLGTQGLQATGQQSNALMGQGQLGWDYGTTKAGNSIAYGNALAANENTGLNNILGIIGTGIGGYNALYNGGTRAGAPR